MSLYDLAPWGGGKHAAPAKASDEHPLHFLQREIDDLFSDFFRGNGFMHVGGNGVMRPEIDVAETSKGVQVTVDLPGVDEKDIEVTVADGVLTIKGEKKAEKEQKDKHFHRVERSYGMFERSLGLPVDVDEDKIKATFAKGVLEIMVPKKPGAKPSTKKVAVKAA